MTVPAQRRRAGGCRFSAREIASLIGNARVIWDEGLPGFGLRFSGNGRRTWIVFTRIKGVVTRISLGGPPIVTESEARAKAQLLILEAKVRRDPLAPKRNARATPMFAERCVRLCSSRQRARFVHGDHGVERVVVAIHLGKMCCDHFHR